MEKTAEAVRDEEAAGFDSVEIETPAPATATAVPEKTVEPPAVDPKAVAPAPEPVPAPAKKPEYVRVTKEELEALKAGVAKTTALEESVTKLTGSVGNVFQIVNELKSKTPKGAPVELTDDVVSDLAEDYPELSQGLLKVLKKALVGQVGTGTPAPVVVDDKKPETPVVDPEAESRRIAAAIEQREITALTEEHPNWREIVGVVDSDGKFDPSNKFRVWLAKQPADYQKKVNNARSVSVISKAIDAFQVEAAKPAIPPKKNNDDVRREVISDAIQPKGSGTTPAPANSVDAAFDQGFKQRRQTR